MLTKNHNTYFIEIIIVDDQILYFILHHASNKEYTCLYKGT